MKRQLLALASFLMLLGLVAFLSRQYFSLEFLAAKERDLRHIFQTHPAISLVIAFLVYVVASLVPGTLGKSVVYGWLFGVWWGTLLVNTALTTSAALTFQLSRYVFREPVWSRFGTRLEVLENRFERHGGFYLMVLRLLHVPYTPLNYIMGGTRLSLWDFWWGTQLGLLPGCTVMAFAGSRLPTLTDIAERGVFSILTPDLVVALLLLSLLPLVIRWGVSRFAGGRREVWTG